jgi:hypothetical protein
MHATDEVRRIQQVDDDAETELSQDAESYNPGSETRACIVRSGGNFPSVAGAFYLLEDLALLGDEVEGATATIDPSGTSFLAFNLGTGIPTADTTKVEATFVPYRWVFTYFG